MKKFALAFAAMSLTIAPAQAAELPIKSGGSISATLLGATAQYDDDDDDDRRWRRGRGNRNGHYKHRHRGRDRDRVRVVRVYDDRGYYAQPRRITRNSRMWRGNNGRYYCRRDNGTTGLVIGAGVGALAGHEIAGRGDRTLGAILGGAVGALIGREIDRGSLQCR